jgi:hypothetical protein
MILHFISGKPEATIKQLSVCVGFVCVWSEMLWRVLTMGTEECSDKLRIPSNTLATLRGILISSLSRENLGNIDIQSSLGRGRKVTFQELHHAYGECLRADEWVAAKYKGTQN